MGRKINKYALKISPKYFDDVASGRKNFEIRKNDRNYQVGDYVKFKEWKDGHYTERETKHYRITYILTDCPQYGLQEGYCILALV